MTNDIFSLFDLADEHETNRKEEAMKKKIEEDAAKKQQESEESLKKKLAADKEKAVASADSKQTEKTSKNDEFKPNEDTVIKYYGDVIPITSYITVEELAEGIATKKDGEIIFKPLDTETLRKRMEKEFPELVKNHTDIVFIEQKNMIIPVMRAKKKGNCSKETLSLDSVSPFYSKIPYNLLFQFIKLAKVYGEQGLEIHADIYFDISKKHYFLDVPAQEVHAFWTEVTECSSDIAMRVMDSIKVMEIHSHHTMKAFPSTQDNESERVPGLLYAIVGRTDQYIPELTCRFFISEERGHVSVNLDQIFSTPFESLPVFNYDGIGVNG